MMTTTSRLLQEVHTQWDHSKIHMPLYSTSMINDIAANDSSYRTLQILDVLTKPESTKSVGVSSEIPINQKEASDKITNMWRD